MNSKSITDNLNEDRWASLVVFSGGTAMNEFARILADFDPRVTFVLPVTVPRLAENFQIFKMK